MSTYRNVKEYPLPVAVMTHAVGQMVFAIAAFVAIALCIALFFILRPYDGMYIGANSGQMTVVDVYPGGPADAAGILKDDVLISVDGQPVNGYGDKPLYRRHYKAGEIINYVIRRDGLDIPVAITMGGRFENVDLMIGHLGSAFLAVSFWAIGALLCLLAPITDVRARLVGILWLLMGLAMAAGGLGVYTFFWGTYTTLEALWGWLAFAFIAVHLHFPAPSLSRRLRSGIVWGFTFLATTLSALLFVNDWILKPRGLWLPKLGLFYVSDAGLWLLIPVLLASVVLLIRNRLTLAEPESRRQVGIILWGTLLGLAPFVMLTMIPRLLFGMGGEYVSGRYTPLFSVFMPLAYAYVIYQRRLLRIDLVINRLVVLFVFALVILASAILLVSGLTAVFGLPQEFGFLGALVAAMLTAPAPRIYRGVQRQVNHVLYGTDYDLGTVTARISKQFARTVDKETLTDLLIDTLSGQMGIARTALFLVERGVCVQQVTDGRSQDRPSIPLSSELCQTLRQTNRPTRAKQLWSVMPSPARACWEKRFAWGEVFTPIIFEGELVGLLILGERTGGSLYSQQDLDIVHSVTRQTALAYANVQLVERLRGLAQRLVQADEEHRRQVANDLHDVVLQELFFIKQDLLRAHNDEQARVIDNTVRTLRRLIKDQRPPLLDRGLAPALAEIAREMEQTTGGSPSVVFQNSLEDCPLLPDDQATALYRIAQESLINAVKHAQADRIVIALDGSSEQQLRLSITDNGIGLPSDVHPSPGVEGHYGLASMHERAMMVGANLSITSSATTKGTTVEVCVMAEQCIRSIVEPTNSKNHGLLFS